MALLIQSSNRVETLQQNLSSQLAREPLADPFAPEIIVVPTFATGRWLNLRFAQQQGIAANIQYPMPAAWLWQLASMVINDVVDIDPLAPALMSWRIFAKLQVLLPQTDFRSLQEYLNDDDSGVKRWQLSSRIAELFDRYQHYRPQMLRNRSEGRADNGRVDNGQANNWQPILWQSLVKDLAGNHRIEILGQLIDRLNQPKAIPGLGERISLFAISSLPPLFIEVIHALAQHTDITLYQHSPTDQYWADLKTRKSLSRMRLQNPEQANYFETGNELLASWGRQGQVMQDLLLEHGALPVSEIDISQPPGNACLLQSIQQNIFDLEAETITAKPDSSLSVHICHSALRECQVLHDYLLTLLGGNSRLKNEDILVMVPEISRYAPYIEAVFAHDENQARPYLPWNLSDISIADEHPLIQTFLQLLNLPNSRFEYSEILSLLEISEIRKRFAIDEQALDDIHNLLEQSQVRWGIDAEFKIAMDLPPTLENTWQQARQRIFAG